MPEKPAVSFPGFPVHNGFMRIWDIHPGYLNRQSLLGEHRELHAVVSILTNNKQGYSKHPETLRWQGYGWAIQKRHQLLATEMTLRGYREQSPVTLCSRKGYWPEICLDEPFIQFELLKQKYAGKDHGRISLPETGHQLWYHHKYSVLARDPALYKTLGRTVSNMSPKHDFSELSRQLTLILRTRPSDGGIRETLQHLWDCVSFAYNDRKCNMRNWSLRKLFKETQTLAMSCQESHLYSSTALSELEAWL